MLNSWKHTICNYLLKVLLKLNSIKNSSAISITITLVVNIDLYQNINEQLQTIKIPNIIFDVTCAPDVCIKFHF